jgi:hypothetical protein
MPYCPTCKSEYRPGFDTCSDCGAELVEELKHEEAPAPKEEVVPNPEAKGWVKLVNVMDDQEAELVTGMLKAEGIPVLKKSQDAGGGLAVLKGTEIGIDLYVPYVALRNARIILRQDDEEAARALERQEFAGPAPREEQQGQGGFKLTWLLGLFLALLFTYVIVQTLQ